MDERFNNNCSVPSELWIINNALHAKVIESEHRDAYVNKMLKFYEESM
jgi:hypothetical protein